MSVGVYVACVSRGDGKGGVMGGGGQAGHDFSGSDVISASWNFVQYEYEYTLSSFF